MQNWIQAIGELFRRDRAPAGALADYRMLAYNAWDGYYDNTIYLSTGQGGQRDEINRALGNEKAADLAGVYNPVGRVVDLYQHVLGGQFDDEIRAETDNELILDPLRQIWRWSNINRTKQRLCKLAPLHGNVGLRIVAEPQRGRVRINVEHPQVIREIDIDQQGNVDAVLLEYDLEVGALQDREIIRIRELQTKERFQTWKIEHGQAIPFDLTTLTYNGPMWEYANELGVVPYVLLGHTADLPWSNNAFYQARQAIDRLNALITHINVQIHEHVVATWLISGSGAAPEKIEFTSKTVLYHDAAGGSPITMKPLIADLSLSDAITEAQAMIAIIEDMLPELKATGGKFLSGQSGETIAQLRRPAEDRLVLARANYEDALVRAQMLALSHGVLYGLWDIGTGTGRDAAERAYQQGYEDHKFNQRPAMPLTDQERLAIAQQKKALGFSQRSILTELGVEDVDAELAEAERARDANRASFAQAFDRGAS